MSTVIMKCTKCGKIIEKNAYYFGIESEATLMCQKCQKMTKHKMIDLHFDQDDPQIIQDDKWEWTIESGLKYIDDETLDIAIKLAQYDGLISYHPVAYRCMRIDVYYKDCCDETIFHQLISDLKEGKEITLTKESEIFTAVMNQPITLCNEATCSFHRCIFKIAGYVKYLIGHQLLEESLKERLDYRKEKNIPVTYYNFEWTPSFHLGEISDNEYNLANDLLRTKSISLHQNLLEGKINISHCEICEDNGKSNPVYFKTKIETMKEHIHKDIVTCELEQTHQKCSYQKCQQCEHIHCPIIVAAYIEYLKNTKQIKRLQEERNKRKNMNTNFFSFVLDSSVIDSLKTTTDGVFSIAKFLQENNYVSLAKEKQGDIYRIYIAHPDLIHNEKVSDCLLSLTYDYNVCKSRNLKTSKIIHYAAIIDYLKKTNQFDRFFNERKKESETMIASLEWYEKKIPQISHVLKLAESKNVNLLRCVIQGEPKVGKSELATKIAYILAENKKISSKTINKYNLQQLTETLTKHTVDGYQYFPLQKNQLYVLTGIQEFLLDYKAYASTTIPSYEYRKKGIQHVMDLLKSLSHDTYVILEGTQKEIEGLLALDEKIHFIFSENRLIFKSLTISEIFHIFVNGLSDEVSQEIKKHKEFYEQFEDYITYNDKYLPFQNKELGNYLAKYCNDRHALILPPHYYHKTSTQELLNDIVGMDNIKKKLNEFENYAKFLKKAMMNDLHIPSTNLHMVFTGNPGTGKTLIARMVADILFAYDLIRENKLIEVERKDLVASHIGQTAGKTADIIEKARGGVLFIDEAYSLDGKSERDFGHEAIATLIKAMEDFKDELVVIFAGYKDEMEDFIQMNAGIASRIGYTFDFHDYSSEELTEIYRRKMLKTGFEIDEDVYEKVMDICTYYRQKRNFGNGRFVDKLVQETIMNYANQDHEYANKIQSSDIPQIKDLLMVSGTQSSSLEEQLDHIVGMEDIKKQVKQFEKYIAFHKKVKEHNVSLPSSHLHMLFTGNPGTGKTTVARIIANLLYDLGILYENKVVEVERKDLVAGYVGQTAIKTNEVIEKAMGGVLFVDEAYSLDGGYANDFGKEAVATLIKAMEDHKDRLVVIFAGYEDEMRCFVDMNPGIASRIGYTFHFDDYSADELTEIFCLKMQNTHFNVESEAVEQVQKIMQYFCHVPRFGNGRFVDNVVQKTIMKHAEQCNEDNLLKITSQDIPSIREVIQTTAMSEAMIDPDKMTQDVLERIAIHEIGHALLQKTYFPNQQIKKITIDPEGTGALGYVEYENLSSIQPTRDELFHDIVVCMAGLACEELCFHHYASGGSNDLRRATLKAKYMIMKLGMSKHGFAVIDVETSRIIKEVNELLDEAFKEAKHELGKWKDTIGEIQKYLMEHKTMDEETLLSLISDKCKNE